MMDFFPSPILKVTLFLVVLPGCVIGCVAPKRAHHDQLIIRGTARFEDQVQKALALLQGKATGAYTVVTNDIGVIQQSKRSGMKAYLNPPRFEMSDGTAFYSLTWCAGCIAHDSFHSKLYHDYLRAHPGARSVPDPVWTGEAAEKACSEHQIQVLKDIGAPVAEVDWCRQTNQYWKVKYRDRNW
jgi:hypothetical protein